MPVACIGVEEAFEQSGEGRSSYRESVCKDPGPDAAFGSFGS